MANTIIAMDNKTYLTSKLDLIRIVVGSKYLKGIRGLSLAILVLKFAKIDKKYIAINIPIEYNPDFLYLLIRADINIPKLK